MNAPPEVEAYLREKVAQLPRGGTFTDHVFITHGHLIAERDLLGALGCDVSMDPPVLDPFAARERVPMPSPAERKAATETVGS